MGKIIRIEQNIDTDLENFDWLKELRERNIEVEDPEENDVDEELEEDEDSDPTENHGIKLGWMEELEEVEKNDN